MKRLFLFIALMSVATNALAAFGYYSPISINAGQIPPATLPVFRAAGAKSAGTTGAVTVAAPAGVATGDLEILIAEVATANTLSITANGGGSWSAMTNTPITVTGGEKLYIWYRQRVGGDGDPDVTASADHVCAARLAYQTGTYDTSDPFEVETTGTETTSDTSFSFVTGVSTTGINSVCLVVSTILRDSNTASVPVCTNANLTNLNSRANYCTNSGNGGGFGVTEGTLVIPGAVGTFANTYAAASAKSYITFAIKPGPKAQTDFPVLVSQTDNRFKTTGNGGHVQNANGYDIRPYSDLGLTTAITGYELERYNATTGEVIMWVKVASLSSSTTPIYLAYGNASLNTDGSSTTTWSNSFLGVYHLADGTSLNVNSATGSNNGTNHSATATTGQIDGAAGFASASSQYIDCGTGMNTVAMTHSAWVNHTTFPSANSPIIARINSGATNYFTLEVRSDGKLSCFALTQSAGSVSYDGTGTITLSTGTWYYVVLTYGNTSGLTGYVNASVDKNVNTLNSLTTGNVSTYLGHEANTTTRYLNGILDEARVSSVERSADWITTEYNNQSAPGTFEILGTEVALSVANNNWFYFIP